ncbi:hypothetical protein JX266_001856 [Neoarthrinium moseri]|uniref:uncharacterized protein n=1 Tax=Neoarthrinium moseri TaxID=1658444 RepID=UPI001FDCDB53|nr:uncharacterized protein JN550_000950 [Neoarthrinium moseri]KAI1853150.1 hypothetical protein JX266_001856 [Neoarthrinium moseri]KAI1876878.1 hypothetical protein JN550_000950 [Neoarthrinium moseri]
MKVITILSFIGGASSALAVSLRRQSDCPAIHVFGARETTAPPGFGSSQLVVRMITTANSGATSEAIIYPASSDPSYAISVSAGIEAVTKQATAFHQQCPESRIVMVGYSQGAQIMDDAFCGGPDGTSLNTTMSLVPKEVGNMVAAIIMMGNPRHVDGLPFNVGTAVEGGFAARPVGFQCPAYASIIQSYCDATDPFCSKGVDAASHQAYPMKYGQQAFQFVQKKLNATVGTSASNSTRPASSEGVKVHDIGFTQLLAATILALLFMV